MTLVHVRALAGIDDRITWDGSACGQLGLLADAGDYTSVTCPECKTILRILGLVPAPSCPYPREDGDDGPIVDLN